MPKKKNRDEKKKEPAAKGEKAAAVRKKSGPGDKKSGTATGKRQSAKTGPTGKRKVPAKEKKPGYIVGIGSSAGGLEALKEFFSSMDDNSGMAFVVVPHLDPSHKSIMAELLQRHTHMPVAQAEDGVSIEADHVYVIPPGRLLGIGQGVLHLLELPDERGVRHPIDFFFRSLAQDRGDRAIAVVLSGTGSEGAVGIREIKGAEGLVIVQQPTSAKYDGMPLSSILTGLVDYVLEPADIGRQLLDYVTYTTSETKARRNELTDGSLQKIFFMIRAKTGHDFSRYKPKTILRRVERRMAIHQIDSVREYLRYLQHNEAEVELLFKEFLIRVTNFFRDPAAFARLQEKVLPLILQHVPGNKYIRVWVPACSSGEEAYSVAMILHEYLTRHRHKQKIQIFATDIDEGAIETARTGMYPESIGVDVTGTRLERYFNNEEGSYRVHKSIREMIVFAKHNAIKDPPFSRLDLICCRNLLIYLNNDLQKKLMAVFHYALKPTGFLFLGSSETIGSSPELFSVFDSKWKIYKPLERTLYLNELHFSGQHPVVSDRRVIARDDPGVVKQRSLGDLTRNMLLDMYAPATVIINPEGVIVYFYGRTGKYLEPASGRADLNIFNLARPELRTVLRRGLKTIKDGEKEFLHQGLRLLINGSVLIFNLKMLQIRNPDHVKGLVLVIFEEAEIQTAAETDRKTAARTDGVEDPTLELQYELRTVKEDLQTTIEELEASNEELQSANEELQSTNEELETSREELQSLNEELMTVNAEEQEKIEQLSRSTDDMKNLLASTEIISIFLDLELRIRNFTPESARVFKLINSDTGRPFGDIVNNLEYDKLGTDLREVLKTLIPREHQILDSKGYWYLMKILPYRKQDNIIDGIVITLVDISKQKHAEKLLAESEDRRDIILEQSGECFFLIDKETGYIIDANDEFQKLTGRHAWELKELQIWELMPRENLAAAREKPADISPQSLTGKSMTKLLAADGGRIPVDMQCREIKIADRKYLQCLITRTDEQG